MSTDLPKIYLIRHGATEWSLAGKHTGRTDLPLLPQGEDEASRLKSAVASISSLPVYVSPLRRARRTAELLGFSHATVEPDIAEWNYGEYEGLTTKEIRDHRPGWKILEDGCPGGENLAAVEGRAARVINMLRASKESAILVAHGHFLSVFAGVWLGLGGRGAKYFYLGTASLSIASYHHSLEEPIVRLWNDRSAHTAN